LTAFARSISFDEDLNNNPNEIFLNGFICKKPVYRTTPFGREISDMLVAVNRNYGKSDYIPCIAWGRNAKFAGSLEVGSNVQLWGRIQSRTYLKKLENDETEERTAYEVSLSKIELNKE
jgi:single-stranded DNA-binding protein